MASTVYQTLNGQQDTASMLAQLVPIGYNGSQTDPNAIAQAYATATGSPVQMVAIAPSNVSTGGGGSSGGGGGGGSDTSALEQQIAAGFAASSGMSLKDLAEKQREFDQTLAFQKQQWEQQGLPQLEIQKRAQALAEQQVANNLGIAQGQLGLNYLTQAANLKGPADYIQSYNFQHAAQGNPNVPTFLSQLSNGVTQAGFQGPAVGSSMPAALTMQGLTNGLSGGSTAAGGTNATAQPGGATGSVFDSAMSAMNAGSPGGGSTTSAAGGTGGSFVQGAFGKQADGSFLQAGGTVPGGGEYSMGDVIVPAHAVGQYNHPGGTDANGNYLLDANGNQLNDQAGGWYTKIAPYLDPNKATNVDEAIRYMNWGVDPQRAAQIAQGALPGIGPNGPGTSLGTPPPGGSQAAIDAVNAANARISGTTAQPAAAAAAVPSASTPSTYAPQVSTTDPNMQAFIDQVTKLYQSGGGALAPGTIESLGPTGTSLLTGAIDAIGGDSPGFIDSYKRAKVGQGAAQAA